MRNHGVGVGTRSHGLQYHARSVAFGDGEFGEHRRDGASQRAPQIDEKFHDKGRVPGPESERSFRLGVLEKRLDGKRVGRVRRQAERPANAVLDQRSAFRARDLRAVDEAGGGARDAEREPLLDVALDLAREGSRLKQRAKVVAWDSQLTRDAHQFCSTKSLSRLEDAVVHFPELAPFAGGEGGRVNRPGLAVDREREALVDPPDPVRIAGHDLAKLRRQRSAERAEKVRELDDRHRRAGRPKRAGVAGEGGCEKRHASERRGQKPHGVGFYAPVPTRATAGRPYGTVRKYDDPPAAPFPAVSVSPAFQ